MDKSNKKVKRHPGLLFYDHFKNTHDYAYVLISLVALIFLPSFSVLINDDSNWVFRICFSLTIFTSIYMITDHIRDFLIGAFLGVLTLLVFWGEFAIHHTIQGGISSQLISLAFFWYVGLQLTRSLIKEKKITLSVILGTTVGYLLIGVLYGQICGVLETLVPGSFRTDNDVHSSYDLFYFSFMTMTTVGYGDVLPNSNPARSLAILIALSGQMYLTVLVAILIGKFLKS